MRTRPASSFNLRFLSEGYSADLFCQLLTAGTDLSIWIKATFLLPIIQELYSFRIQGRFLGIN